MSLIGAVHSELIKIKHTPFRAIHFFLPLTGALLFIFYFIIYENTDNYKKLRLVLELTATVFPLLISVIVSLDVMLEEKASHFQTLLAVPDRKKIFLSKLTVLYGMGLFSLFSLFLFFVLGTYLFGIAETVQLSKLIQSVAGIAFFNLIIYILHLFLSLKFGFGISLFWGVFECLQCILYSNIEFSGTERYIPFAWAINWIQDIMNNNLTTHIVEWIWIVILTAIGLLLTLVWFSHWEGRKNYE